jgi:hypothetical protein
MSDLAELRIRDVTPNDAEAIDRMWSDLAATAGGPMSGLSNVVTPNRAAFDCRKRLDAALIET